MILYQDYTYIEDSYGEASVLFVISDVYSDLYSDLSTATEIDFVKLSEISKDVELKSGEPAEDELSFTINGMDCIEYATELNLFLSALDVSNVIYCAVFFNASLTSRTKNELVFAGVIDPAIEMDAIKWDSNEYEEPTGAIYEYSFKARPYQNTIIEGIAFSGLLDSVIADSYVNANIASPVTNQGMRPSFLAAINLYTNKLFPLSRLIRYLANYLTIELNTQYGITLNFVFDSCAIPGYFYPQRYTVVTCNSELIPAVSTNYEYGKSGDGKQLTIDPDGSLNLDTEVWIQYNYLTTSTDSNGIIDVLPENSNENYRIDKKVDNYIEFLYKVAESFGLFLIMSYDDAETLRVSFTSRKDFERNKVYLKDASEHKIKVSSARETNTTKLYFGKTSPLTSEGKNVNCHNTYSPPSYTGTQSDNGETELLFTIGSPPVTMDKNWYWDDVNNAWVHCNYYGLPCNHLFYYTTDCNREARFNTCLPSNSIWIKTTANGYANHYADYYAPTANLYTIQPFTTGIWDVKKNFSSLSSYLNFLHKAENNAYFELETEITVPYWNGFSNNADGSSPSWNVLELGSIITVDTIDYIVISIKYSLDKLETSIKLSPASRFDWTDFLVSTVQSTADVPVIESSYNDYSVYTASETITKGDAVYYSGGLYKAISSKSCINKIVGVAMNSGGVGDTIYVNSNHIIEVDTWTWNVGQPVYIRTSLSQTPIVYKVGSEDAYIKLGRAISSTAIIYELEEFELNYLGA